MKQKRRRGSQRIDIKLVSVTHNALSVWTERAIKDNGREEEEEEEASSLVGGGVKMRNGHQKSAHSERERTHTSIESTKANDSIFHYTGSNVPRLGRTGRAFFYFSK